MSKNPQPSASTSAADQVLAALAVRLCPSCGELADGLICPADGIGTIRLIPAMPHAWLARPGQVLAGKYRILDEIGSGGHGVVYRAEHLFGLGTVALKLLRSEDPDIEEMRRFFREGQVTARLRGPHTARVYDVGQTEFGSLYLAMELVDGVTLEAHMRQAQKLGRVLGEDEAIRVGAAVLSGLEETHANGLVHRDLKPSNIAIGNDGRDIKILDFGLARVIGSSLTPSTRALGTPHYMSPEQCSGLPVDRRADLYALGIVLYRCVTGALPFRDANPLTTMWAQVHAPVPDLASAAPVPLSPRFTAVVQRALSKQSAHRFASAGEMRAALLGEVHVGFVPGGLFDAPARRVVDQPAPHLDDIATESATALKLQTFGGTTTASAALQRAAVARRWLVPVGLATAAALAVVWGAQAQVEHERAAVEPQGTHAGTAPTAATPPAPTTIQAVPAQPPPSPLADPAPPAAPGPQVSKVPAAPPAAKKMGAASAFRKRAADWKLPYLPQ